MASILHFGILAIDGGDSVIDPEQPKDVERRLPDGFITDGDSFLEWGEIDNEDWTLHVLRPIPDTLPAIPGFITQCRSELGVCLTADERLADYVVVSDHDDWGEGVRIWVIDGSLT